MWTASTHGLPHQPAKSLWSEFAIKTSYSCKTTRMSCDPRRGIHLWHHTHHLCHILLLRSKSHHRSYSQVEGITLRHEPWAEGIMRSHPRGCLSCSLKNMFFLVESDFPKSQLMLKFKLKYDYIFKGKLNISIFLNA